MFNTVQTRGISGGSLFKLLFVGYLLSVGPLIIIFGIFSLFGAETIHVNNEAVTGFKGLIASIIMAPIFSGISACINWVFIAFGQWLFTRFHSLKFNFRVEKKD